jgi:hypothetical protein
MADHEPEDLQQIKADTLEGMREYLADVVADGGDPGYTEAEIGECEAILDAFLAKVSAAKPGHADAVMAAVRDAVLALNTLNEACSHGLIETDQREEICSLIVEAAQAAGVGAGEDLTEQWREW